MRGRFANTLTLTAALSRRGRGIDLLSVPLPFPVKGIGPGVRVGRTTCDAVCRLKEPSHARTPPPRGTGDLGLVVERAIGQVLLIETQRRHGPGMHRWAWRFVACLYRLQSGRALCLRLRSRRRADQSRSALPAHRQARGAGRQQYRRRHLAGREAGGGGQLPAGRREGVLVRDAWSCWPTSRPSMLRASARRSSAWRMPPTAASPSACSRQARSGSRTWPIRATRASRSSRTSARSPTTRW